jgi:two-component system, LytTR family, response regulator
LKAGWKPELAFRFALMQRQVDPTSLPKIRVIVADDEAPARARLRNLLKQEPDFILVAECANGRQAVELILREKPDLVLLDMQMPGLSGLEVCDALKSAADMPLVIFVTAFDHYALKAFEVHAIDYLLKPFDGERFRETLRHARQRLRGARRPEADSHFAALLEQLRLGAKPADRLVFKKDGRVIFLRTELIDWIEADGNYVRLHAGSEAHYFRESLADLEAQLPSAQFLRISRSVIVNLDRVKELQPLFYGDYLVILHDDSRLNLSRKYRSRIEHLLARRL